MKNSYAKMPAFTIVELLIVIVVIGILAAISVVVYGGIRTNAENSKTVSGVRQYVTLLQMYKEANGGYPAYSGSTFVCLGSGYIGGVCARNSEGGVVGAENASFNTQLAAMGSLPDLSTKELATSVDTIVAGASFESGSRMIRYHLDGPNRPCPMGSGPYTYGKVTQCRIVLD